MSLVGCSTIDHSQLVWRRPCSSQNEMKSHTPLPAKWGSESKGPFLGVFKHLNFSMFNIKPSVAKTGNWHGRGRSRGTCDNSRFSETNRQVMAPLIFARVPGALLQTIIDFSAIMPGHRLAQSAAANPQQFCCSQRALASATEYDNRGTSDTGNRTSGRCNAPAMTARADCTKLGRASLGIRRGSQVVTS